ncbi:uncharacterized protein C2845_PM11G14520 [Panicum miliaceum]|uniref:RING-type E3 ubiquitin transferase n=1 Tax=Panicum miliaceum TaxID=4540 RepID=A0A3L6RQI0_PANMI|nr:uncharacterized protein C2845_PM11G14520 [Panicum miliaceum]
MEEYSDRRSRTEIAFRRRGSRFSYRNQNPEERTNHISDGLGSSTRLDPMKTGVTDNQERPRYLRDSFNSSSSKLGPASSSKFPLRKFEEKRRQPLSTGVDIAESGRRKAEPSKQLEGSKKIIVGDESSDTLRIESKGFTTEQGRLLTPDPEGSHFAGPSAPDVQPSGCSSDSVYSRRFEFMRKRASDPESSSRSRSFSGLSNSDHSSPTYIRDTGPRIRMNEQLLSQQIIRSSSRNQKESAVSEEYKAGEEIGQLPCEHRYHVCCIGQWLRQKNWCPVCKASAVPSMD